MIICADGCDCPGCGWKNAKTLDDLSDANLDCPSIMEIDSILRCKDCLFFEAYEERCVGMCSLCDCIKLSDGFCDEAEKKKNR